MVKKILVYLFLGVDQIWNNLIEKSRNYNFPINFKLVISDNKKA